MPQDQIEMLRIARRKLLERRRAVVEELAAESHTDEMREQIDRLEKIQTGIDLLNDAMDNEEEIGADEQHQNTASTGDVEGWSKEDSFTKDTPKR